MVSCFVAEGKVEDIVVLWDEILALFSRVTLISSLKKNVAQLINQCRHYMLHHSIESHQIEFYLSRDNKI